MEVVITNLIIKISIQHVKHISTFVYVVDEIINIFHPVNQNERLKFSPITRKLYAVEGNDRLR